MDYWSSSLGVGNIYFYQLKVTIQELVETMSCLTFDASALQVETALNVLPILFNRGGVFVPKTDTSSGFVGDAHFYKVYFSGGQLVGDVEEMVAERNWCPSRSWLNKFTCPHPHIDSGRKDGTSMHHLVFWLRKDKRYPRILCIHFRSECQQLAQFMLFMGGATP